MNLSLRRRDEDAKQMPGLHPGGTGTGAGIY
jgi:hypothetical protein